MTIPYIFNTQSGTVPLSELDSNFATPITIGITPVALGGSVNIVSGLTLFGADLGTPTAGNLTNCTGVAASAVTGTLPVANGGTGVTTSTGSGNTVLSTSPTLVTPILGTPTSGTLTNCTFPTLNQNTTGTAANVTTNANLTGMVTSVGNAASLGSFTSANLSTALTDETGTGAAVFATSPTLVTPILGTPSSGNLQSCTADGTNTVGFKNIPQNLQAVSYTCVLADSGKHLFNTVSSVNWTIPANASVAYSIGTVLTFVNGSAASSTIAITTDTMQLVNTATTGTRTLATNGMATAIKVTATKWYISGSGLT